MLILSRNTRSASCDTQHGHHESTAHVCRVLRSDMEQGTVMRSLRSLICAIVGLGWITSLAAAPNLSMSDYQVALRRGRQAVSESAFVDAVTQFEAALRARPNDPVALSELGFAALQAGDLARARTATESALATTKDRALLAASLYNLGRIAEATDDRNAAVAAYRRSLTLRKSAEVTGRLAALDPSTPAAVPLSVAPFQGPFASLDAFCKRARKEATALCPAPFSTGNDYFALQETLTSPPPPMQSVRVVSIRPHNDTVNDCHLLVQTGSGFYSLGLRSDNGCTPREITVQSMGNARSPAVLLRLITQPATVLSDKPNARWVGHYQEWLYVCALDMKQKPACVGPIDLGRVQQHAVHALKPGESPDWDYRRRPSLDGNGTLRIEPEGWKPGEPLPNSAHLGSHALPLWAK